MVGKVLSLMVVVVYMAAALQIGGVEPVAFLVGWMIFPIMAIWFGDWLGNRICPIVPIIRKSPGRMVRLMGWVLLLLPGIIYLATKGMWQGIA